MPDVSFMRLNFHPGAEGAAVARDARKASEKVESFILVLEGWVLE